MSNKIKYNRRDFLSNTAMALGAFEFATMGLTDIPFINNDQNKMMNSGDKLGPIKQINAGLLNVGYAEVGPANGSPVILLPWLALRYSQFR
jgi:hypothetical protein